MVPLGQDMQIGVVAGTGLGSEPLGWGLGIWVYRTFEWTFCARVASLGCAAVTFRVDAGFSQKSAGRYGCSGCIAVWCRYLRSTATMSALHLCGQPLVITTGRGVIVPIDGIVAHDVSKPCGTLIQSNNCLFLAHKSTNAISTFSCMYWAAVLASLSPVTWEALRRSQISEQGSLAAIVEGWT